MNQRSKVGLEFYFPGNPIHFIDFVDDDSFFFILKLFFLTELDVLENYWLFVSCSRGGRSFLDKFEPSCYNGGSFIFFLEELFESSIGSF
jgi:hypothetical protein